MGAAVMAMAATGTHDSLEIAAKAMSRHGNTTEPDAANHEIYRELGEIQAATYHGLKDVFDQQYEFAQRHPLH